MNRRPGHVDVSTEAGFCSFCGRTRNLRREEHHLGNLVRTIVTCESCHRTLSSSIGVAQAEPAADEKAAEVKTPAAEVAPAKAKPAPARAAPAKRTARPTAAKKSRRTGKPTSTAAKKTTRKK